MVVSRRFAVVVLAATVLVAVAVRSVGALVAVDGALLAFALLDVALAGSVRALRFERAGATTTRLGEPATVTLVARNPGRRRVVGVLRDAWVPSAGVAVTRHPLRLEPGRVVRLDTVLVPTRRGERRADRVVVRSLGPLGLAGRQGSHRVTWAVRVLPAFPSRRHLPSRLARLRELDGRTALQVRGQGTEFDSLREYVARRRRPLDRLARDRARRRRGGPHVAARAGPAGGARLDTGRTGAARIGDGTRLDAAMDAAQLLAALASRAGDRVDLLAFDRTVRADVRGTTGPDLLAQLAARSPTSSPSSSRPTPAARRRGAGAGPAARARRAAHRARPGRARGGPAAGPAGLTTRHTVVLASVRDPRVQAMAASRGDIAAVYDAAAGTSALAARERMAELLGRLDVEVVDSGPDSLAPDLADRYLALKSAGRL